jgi:hypothetical protein
MRLFLGRGMEIPVEEVKEIKFFPKEDNIIVKVEMDISEEREKEIGKALRVLFPDNDILIQRKKIKGINIAKIKKCSANFQALEDELITVDRINTPRGIGCDAQGLYFNGKADKITLNIRE